MTAGEMTLLKIVADESRVEAARRLFHIAFPSQNLSEVAFDAVVRNLCRKRLLRRERESTRLVLTNDGQETLAAIRCTEEHAVRELSE